MFLFLVITKIITRYISYTHKLPNVVLKNNLLYDVFAYDMHRCVYVTIYVCML